MTECNHSWRTIPGTNDYECDSCGDRKLDSGALVSEWKVETVADHACKPPEVGSEVLDLLRPRWSCPTCRRCWYPTSAMRDGHVIWARVRRLEDGCVGPEHQTWRDDCDMAPENDREPDRRAGLSALRDG